MNLTILQFDTLNSTNIEAIKQVKKGAQEGLCIVARQQTAGRGRQGRKWVSEKDSGLYFSIVLFPNIESKFLSLLTLMASIAVYETLKELYKLKPDIKWSNDVLINEKKICGILAETSETNNGLAIIVGIGINLTSLSFPEKLKETATSIKQETNQTPDSEKLLRTLTRFFVYFYEILQTDDGPNIIRNEWAKRSSYFQRKNVRVIYESKTVYGKTCGLEENGALRIQTKDGEIKIIQAGDVEKLRANDV